MSKRVLAAAPNLLDLPPEVIALILSKIKNKDLLENVQRVCMNLRRLLKDPAPGLYGVLTICTSDNLHDCAQFQKISRWLLERTAGIDCLVVTDGGQANSRTNDLLCWLLGWHINLKVGLRTALVRAAMSCTTGWIARNVVDRLGSQLVDLKIHTSLDIWLVLFQLQQLCVLRLKVSDGPAVEIPANRQLSSLRVLELFNCTACLSPLLVGSSLPSLKVLNLDGCRSPDGLNIDSSILTGLHELRVVSCKPVLVGGSEKIPLEAMRTLSLDGSSSLDMQLLTGATQLRDLHITVAAESAFPSLLQAIQQMPQLKRLHTYTDTVWQLGTMAQIDRQLFNQGGVLIFSFFAAFDEYECDA